MNHAEDTLIILNQCRTIRILVRTTVLDPVGTSLAMNLKRLVLPLTLSQVDAQQGTRLHSIPKRSEKNLQLGLWKVSPNSLVLIFGENILVLILVKDVFVDTITGLIPVLFVLILQALHRPTKMMRIFLVVVSGFQFFHLIPIQSLVPVHLLVLIQDMMSSWIALRIEAGPS